MFSRRPTRLIAIAAATIAVGGGAYGILSATASTGSSAAPAAMAVSAVSGQSLSGGGSDARSTNAAGGSVGTVTEVSTQGFTLSTPTGGKVTVKESSSTVYDEGTSRSTASAVTKGKTVLVLGKVDSTTIAASQAILAPAINLSKASANVIAFQQPNESEAKTVGKIPASYKEGTGTIVSGTAATKATQAALSSYAGGVVDRVVLLSNGEYEVHYIGTNWPHHIFVTSNFKVVGAND